jgi:cytochrome P450
MCHTLFVSLLTPILQRARQYIRQEKLNIDNKDLSSQSLMHQVIRSELPESEKTEDRLTKEAQTLLGAGTELTASTVSMAAVYILSSPDLLSRLQTELKDTMAQWPRCVPSWPELERLPLLQGIVKESLR